MNKFLSFIKTSFMSVKNYEYSISVENKNLRSNVLRVVLLATALMSFVTVLGVLPNEEYRYLMILMSICCILNLILFFVSSKNVNNQVLTYVYIILQDGIIFPASFVFGGGVYSGTYFLLLMGMLLIGFLLPELPCIVTLILVLLYYLIGLKHILVEGYTVLSIQNTKDFLISIGFFYVLFCGVILYLIRGQQRKFEEEQQKIENSKKILEHTEHAKSQFLANMSSEIRSPMTSIIGLTEIMLREDLDKSIKNDVMVIRDASEDLLTIIDDVLSYSRLDGGEIDLEEKEFSLQKLIESCIEIVANAIGDRKIDIDLEVDHDIPELLYGSEIYIKQVFLYLFFSSLSTMNEGKILFNVSFQRDLDRRIGTLQVKIADNGKGISKYDLASLLSSYKVYDTRQSSNLKGLGMKFSICDALIKSMGGTMLVESIEEVGLSTEITIPLEIRSNDPMISINGKNELRILVYLETDFERRMWANIFEDLQVHVKYVRNKESFDASILEVKYDYIFMGYAPYEDLSDILEKYDAEEYTYVLGKSTSRIGDFGACKLLKKPLSCINMAVVLNGEWQAGKFEKTEGIESFTAKQAKILVVDDNFVNLKVAKGVFKKYDIDVDTADSGRKALEMVENTYYDIVFLDQMMPEMDGVATLKRIRDMKENDYSTLPIIALTASKGSDVRAQLMHAGFQEFIVKPMKARYLEEVLLKFLPENLIERKSVSKPGTKVLQEQENKEELSKSIHLEKALYNVGGDEEALYKLLNNYYREGIEKSKELPQFLKEGQYPIVINMAHGIKYQSAVVGAFHVSECFRQIEIAGKNKDIAYIHTNIDEALREYHLILNDVAQILREKGRLIEFQTKNIQEQSPEQSVNIADLKNFEHQLQLMNLKECEKMLKNICNSNYGEKFNQIFKEIKNLYERFEFEEVKLSLHKIYEEL